MNPIRGLRAFMEGQGILRGITTIALGTGIAQLLVIVTSPIVTRLYSPSDYGVFSVALSVLSILVTVSCLRYEFAVPVPASDLEATNLLVLSIVLAITLSVVALVVLELTGSALLGFFGAAALVPYLPFLILGQLAGGISSALTNWAIRTKTYGAVSQSRITQSGVLVVMQIGLGLARAGAVGLLVGDSISRLSGSTRLAQMAFRTARISEVTRRGIVHVAIRYRRFPIFSAASALLATLGLQSPVLLMIAFYGTTVGGHYALAARICSIPVTLVAGAVGQVFIAEAAPLARDDAPGLRRLFKRVSIGLAAMAIIPALGLAVVAPLGASLIFGSQWAQSGLIVVALVPAYYVEFIAGATGDVLFLLERQDLHLMREIARFALVGGAIPLAAFLHLDAVQAVIMLSVFTGVTYFAYAAISAWAVRSHVPSRGSLGLAALPIPFDDDATGIRG